MDRNNFQGISNFVWWIGVVEDRIDPLAMGRCRCRIIGWHTDNKSLLPTTSLPWAYPVFPVNASQEWTAPLVDDWVIGFFMDGEDGQFPYMLGIMPYIKDQSESSNTSTPSFSSNLNLSRVL